MKDEDMRHIIVMKGAPERILDRSSTLLINGEEVEMTDEWKEAFNQVHFTAPASLLFSFYPFLHTHTSM